MAVNNPFLPTSPTNPVPPGGMSRGAALSWTPSAPGSSGVAGGYTGPSAPAAGSPGAPVYLANIPSWAAPGGNDVMLRRQQRDAQARRAETAHQRGEESYWYNQNVVRPRAEEAYWYTTNVARPRAEEAYQASRQGPGRPPEYMWMTDAEYAGVLANQQRMARERMMTGGVGGRQVTTQGMERISDRFSN